MGPLNSELDFGPGMWWTRRWIPGWVQHSTRLETHLSRGTWNQVAVEGSNAIDSKVGYSIWSWIWIGLTKYSLKITLWFPPDQCAFTINISKRSHIKTTADLREKKWTHMIFILVQDGSTAATCGTPDPSVWAWHRLMVSLCCTVLWRSFREKQWLISNMSPRLNLWMAMCEAQTVFTCKLDSLNECVIISDISWGWWCERIRALPREPASTVRMCWNPSFSCTKKQPSFESSANGLARKLQARQSTPWTTCRLGTILPTSKT